MATRFASILRTLRAAVEQGGRPNIETVLQSHFRTITSPCRGLLETSLGLVVFPKRHPHLPTARLAPGLMLLLSTPEDTSSAPSTPKGDDNIKVYMACSLTVVPSTGKKQAHILLEPSGNVTGPVETLKTQWQEFPAGRAILSVVAERKPVGSGVVDNPRIEHVSTVLFRYWRGRVIEMHQLDAKTSSRSPADRMDETRTLRFLTLQNPARHLMVEIKTEESSVMEPLPNGGKDWGVPTWTQKYTVYQLDQDLAGVKELKGKALESVLELTKLAPFRTPRSGRGAPPAVGAPRP